MGKVKHSRILSIALFLGVPLWLATPLLNQLELIKVHTQSIAQPATVQQYPDQIFREGFAYYQQNKFQEALMAWRLAQAIYHERDSYHAESTTLSMITIAHIAIGEYSEAIQISEPALRLAKRAQDTDLQVQILGNLGIAYEGAGQYVTALTTYRQTLEILEQLPEESKALKRAHILGLMGNTYSSLGDYDRSISLYLESLEISERINDTIGQIATYGNLGTTYFQSGDARLALDRFEDGLRLAQAEDKTSEIAYILSNMGTVYRNQGNFQQALESSYQSLEIARDRSILDLEVDILTNLGLIHEDLGELEQAVDYYEQSLAKTQLLQNPKATAKVLNNLGHGFYNSGRLDEAETHLRNAITLLESLRTDLGDTDNISLFDTQIFTYNLLQQVLIAKGDYETALEITEAGRARAFADLLSSRAPLLSESTLSGRVPPTLPSIKAIKEIAREQNAILVEYSLIPEDAFRVQGRQRGNVAEIHIWVVQPDGTVSFHSQPIPTQSSKLKESVSQLRRSLGISQSLDRGLANANSVDVEKTTEKLREFYKLLIEPIE
ncbi:MAG: tetratricopeptide repeat protein [Cyanobacteria bacterium J06555_13]